MEMKPAHFTLIRFHHVAPSKCLQHPGQRFEKHPKVKRTWFLWIISVSFILKKISSLLFFQQLKTVLKKSIQGDNKNSQAKCSPAVT